jgi:DNA-binding NarL/FixJ family response regulator
MLATCQTPSMENRLRIFIVDDHALFAQGLALLLSTEATRYVEVVGHTTHPEEAVSLVCGGDVDVALVDLAMPRLAGIDVIRSLKKRCPETKVVALTGIDDLEAGQRVLRAGADGYLTKSSDPGVLLAPLFAVASGLCVLRHEMVDALLALARTPPDNLMADLSDQELRLWVLLARGLETGVIAQRMLVSERTTKRMIAVLLRKIGAANRIEAAGLAGRYGILDAAPGN